MNIHTAKKITGFSLIEFLIYLAVSTVLISMISTVGIMVWQSFYKTNALQDVQHLHANIRATIQRIASDAYAIHHTIYHASSSSITFRMYDSVRDPTILSATGTTLLLTEGMGETVPLHSTRYRSNIDAITSYTVGAQTQSTLMLTMSTETESILPSFTVTETVPIPLSIPHIP